MKSRLIFLFVAFITSYNIYSQKLIVDISFTGKDSTYYHQLDSILIVNQNKQVDTTLYYPDTTLTLDSTVSIPEHTLQNKNFKVYQNYPNPVTNSTKIPLYIPEKDFVRFMIYDIQGRKLIKREKILDKGLHTFRFQPGNQKLYLFSVIWKNRYTSIKILNKSNGVNRETLEHTEHNLSSARYKSQKQKTNFMYHHDDRLSFIGYADTEASPLFDSPQSDTTYIFQFATNIPCIDEPFVTYHSKQYQTVQIYNQCWLKENLDVGVQITGHDMKDNDTIEKFCYNNNPVNCSKYGGLYQWSEMMGYSIVPGSQGICPDGWHIPTDEEWMMLEGAADSLYNYPDQEWQQTDRRGYDAAYKLRSDSLGGDWPGSDIYGFSILPGGYRFDSATYYTLNLAGLFWTSSEADRNHIWDRGFDNYYDKVFRGKNPHKDWAFSIRCVKGDYQHINQPPRKPYNPSPKNNADWQEYYVTLSWDCMDIEGDSIYYKVFLGEPDDPPAAGDFQSQESFSAVGLKPNTVYYWKVNAYDTHGNSVEGPIWSFSTKLDCPETFTDPRDGKEYEAVMIDKQCWMAENLNIGTQIESDQNSLNNNTIEKYCYDDSLAKCDEYGGLYKWYELMDYSEEEGNRGICPEGWHIPTKVEWERLSQVVGYGNGGEKLKSKSGWGYNHNGTDVYNFTALPAGFIRPSNTYANLNQKCFFASSSLDSTSVFEAKLRKYRDEFFLDWVTIGYGRSIRCLKNSVSDQREK
ncbi:MAG: hypothetical protein K9J27_10635 [Bacteroidales bacterium]|nr:hypothetical protein [Bacteroidales bacterium]MCF8338339.1 hypothetical protein [Bacteroidales bacterium]